MRALAQGGRLAEAVRESDWLATHRGRAYGEHNLDSALTAANVVQSNLAILTGAELMLASKRPQLAKERLDRFYAAWPAAREVDFLRARLRKLETGLGPGEAGRSRRFAPAAAGA